MSQIIMRIMAVGALLGGLDHLLGCPFGLGQRFEEAFRLLGSLALSMAGIICLAPLLSQTLESVVTPVFRLLGIDPAVFGSVLAIDMGGYQMAMDLAADPRMGQFCGIVVSAIFGCTIVFTIPVGLGAVEEADRPFFTKGILIGLASMPGALVLGGLLWGLSLPGLLWDLSPILLISCLLILGLLKTPERLIRGFRIFAKAIEKLAILGLTLGAVEYMLDVSLLPRGIPLTEAMETVCAIAIVMLGSMPLAELLQRNLKKPFAWLGSRTGLNSVSTTGILVGMVSVVPALVMIPRMDERGKVVCGAFVVCGASTFAAHLGFTMAAEPELAGPLLASKLLGGLLGILLALAATKNKKPA